MECPGITFAVQWKKKLGTASQQDVTSIGLWDPDDSTLDWKTFKSYVCQNLGTVDNISVAYIDSEGDELPIESQCEFREALKFARQRARKGRETILRVDRQELVTSNAKTCKISETVCQVKAKSSHMPCSKQTNKCGSKPKSTANGKNGHHSNANDEKRSKEGKNKSSADSRDLPDVEHSGLLLKVQEMFKKMNLEHVEAPPVWFRRYMHKMKSDIVAEVTSNVLHEIQRAFPSQRDDKGPRCSNSWTLDKNKKKKKLSDEESSDGALGCETRDHKLLKKIEKLHKREKKLEKKLDSKLEKLENKTKRMMEKRSQSKPRYEKIPERKICSVKRRSGDLHFGTYLMDAVLLNDGPASEIIIHPGQDFTKVWEIMNTGTLPWTDKTELRQAWGTSGLEPEETVVMCPILQPGEDGVISMKFRAPEFTGKFKSYWHFYHMGDRFGHWIGCAVVVKDSEEDQTALLDLEDFQIFSTDKQNPLSIDHNIKSNSDLIDKHQLRKIERKEKMSGPSNNRREEYESDYESDNLSVISGPGSESSDTDDENFVVIPMPACFVCDVPLGHAETVPVIVKSEVKDSNLMRSVTINNERIEETRGTSEINDNPVATEVDEDAYENKLLEKVYAVDSAGTCIAVQNCYVSDISSKMENQQFNNSVGETSSEAEPITDQNEQEMPESKNTFTSNTNSNSSSRPLRQDPMTNMIHILPETLITGAVNVASSAYSTARAVISNLRTRQQGDGSDWPWGDFPDSVVQPTDSTTTENLVRLLEMGFNNRILNILLLQRFDNDITKVVAELVSGDE